MALSFEVAPKPTQAPKAVSAEAQSVVDYSWTQDTGITVPIHELLALAPDYQGGTNEEDFQRAVRVLRDAATSRELGISARRVGGKDTAHAVWFQAREARKRGSRIG